jgi:DNA-directed RNA polymerase sigma subunit (sigma70/sigma32)
MTPDEFADLCHQWRKSGPERAKQQQQTARQAWAAVIDANASLSRNAKMIAKRALGMTLAELGEQYGLTRERVRQLTDANFIERQQQERATKRAAKLAALQWWL